MKKYLLTLTVILSTLFLFSCNVTALVTDIIQKEQKTNEIQYKINYTNTSETESEYQFSFEDIPLEYCKNITFDFNSFHGTEGLAGIDGEVGFFFNLEKNNIEEGLTDWEEGTDESKKTCNFYILTIKKYVDYYSLFINGNTLKEGTGEAPTVYEINIYQYTDIYYPNLINKNIIGDKNGYDINTIYCDVACTCTQVVNTVKINEKDFKNVCILNQKLTYTNNENNSFISYNSKNNSKFTKDLKTINGIYSIIYSKNTLKLVLNFKNKN